GARRDGRLDRGLPPEVEVLEADVLVDEVQLHELVLHAVQTDEEIAKLARFRRDGQRVRAERVEGVVDQPYAADQTRGLGVGGAEGDAVAADDLAAMVAETLLLQAVTVEVIVLLEAGER